MNIQLIREKFAERFGTAGELYTSPGCVVIFEFACGRS